MGRKGDEKDDGAKKGGCFGKLLSLLVFSLIAGLGAAIFSVSLPQDLSDIGGYLPAAEAPASPPRDIEAVLRKSLEGDYPVTLSETELNNWLERELKLGQGGVLGQWVHLKRVWVRLNEGVAEIIIEREVAGRPLTVSMFLQVEQEASDARTASVIHLHGGGFHEDLPALKRGGRFGRLTIPQGFLIFVIEDFEKIASLFQTEIELGFKQLARVKIENNRLILDPSSPERVEESGMKKF